MERRWRETLWNDLFLLLFAAFLVIGIWQDGHVFGSETDWLSQHVTIAEYFRQTFYQTGQLLPDFAPQLGGGQNAFYFSYYGLLNPIVLVSYLLPGVSMASYLQAAGILGIAVSGCFVYHWLRRGGRGNFTATLGAIFFLCAAPITFQAHRQLMFVNEMPFLLLALMGVDDYMTDGRRSKLVIGTLLCILCSYFFSVGCIAALCFYTGYRSIEGRRGFQPMTAVLGCVLVAVMAAGALLLPTAYVILAGRGQGSGPSWMELLRPDLVALVHGLLGNGYTLGLTGIALLALIGAAIPRRRADRCLSAALFVLLLFPLFPYLLNGTLYLRPKSLIPFLPLYVFVIARFLEGLLQYQSILARLGVCALCIFAVNGAVDKCFDINQEDRLMSKKEARDADAPEKHVLAAAAAARGKPFDRLDDLTNPTYTMNNTYGCNAWRTSIYSSTNNRDYNRFYNDVLQNPIVTRNRVANVISPNTLFERWMNVRFLIGKNENEVPAGYEKIASCGKYHLYENKATLPLGYVLPETMGRKEFEQVEMPTRVALLFSRVITESGEVTDASPLAAGIVRPVEFRAIALEDRKHLQVEAKDGVYTIQADKNASAKLSLPKPLQDRALVIQFQVSDWQNDPDRDTFITINGNKNKLSKRTAAYPNGNNCFVYVISSQGPLSQLSLRFSQGSYTVSAVKAWEVDLSWFTQAVKQVDPFVLDPKGTRENRIAGTVTAHGDGYFATTLPYDRGFTVKVDGVPCRYERVNTAFVGFPIQAGAHRIELTYHAPYKRLGIFVSLWGILCLAVICRGDRRRGTIRGRLSRTKSVSKK